MGLEIGVLTRVEVEELRVGEQGKIFLYAERIVGSGRRILGTDGVEIAEVLRHIGAGTAVVCRHCEGRVTILLSFLARLQVIPPYKFER